MGRKGHLFLETANENMRHVVVSTDLILSEGFAWKPDARLIMASILILILLIILILIILILIILTYHVSSSSSCIIIILGLIESSSTIVYQSTGYLVSDRLP